MDGADLVMTHYCMLGNQPRMKADSKSPKNQIRFQFAGGQWPLEKRLAKWFGDK
jgi:hypothetical protein